jgi:biopolymer transport protein ExbD
LRAVATKARKEYGPNVPIVIRGDQDAQHKDIQVALNACTEAGFYKFKFAAFKEKNTK